MTVVPLPIQTPRLSSKLFNVTLFSEIADNHTKTYTIHELYAAGEISVVYGAPGTAKSAVLGDQCCHIAAGIPWFGREVRVGAVLYIAAERHQLVKRRMTAFRLHHEIEDALPIAVLDGSFDFFSGPEHAHEIIALGRDLQELTGYAVVQVVIDTKTRAMGAADPNSDKDVAALIGHIDLIKGGLSEAHITIVDHVPHGQPDRMKGSGALAGAADASYLITKDADGIRRITIGSKEPNDGPDELDLTFRLESITVGQTPTGRAVDAPVVIQTNAAPRQPKTNARKMDARDSIVLTAINYVLDNGTSVLAPPMPGVTPKTRAVSKADVKARAIASGLANDDETPEAIKKRFNRSVEKLIDMRKVRQEGPLIWTIQGDGTTGTHP
jgi:hypothetical protein